MRKRLKTSPPKKSRSVQVATAFAQSLITAGEFPNSTTRTADLKDATSTANFGLNGRLTAFCVRREFPTVIAVKLSTTTRLTISIASPSTSPKTSSTSKLARIFTGRAAPARRFWRQSSRKNSCVPASRRFSSKFRACLTTSRRLSTTKARAS